VINEKGSTRSARFCSFTLEIFIVVRSPRILNAGIMKVVIKTNSIISKAILPETGCKDSGMNNNNMDSKSVGMRSGCNV
jgi:hypothetical protein